MGENEVMVRPEASAPAELSVNDVLFQVQKIQGLMKEVMKVDEHYGIIPGTKKPSLFKAGAEKVAFIFRLEPEYDIIRHELPNGHREFDVTCTLRQIGSGIKVGSGVGSCSTMESKYRYRNEELKEEVGNVPKSYWDAPKDDQRARDAALITAFGPGKYRCKKTENAWKVYKVTGDGEKKENPDIADMYNTVLKMAKKRAYVDATLTATAASDFFTQDVEDFAPEQHTTPKETPAPATAPTSSPAPQPAPHAKQEPIKKAEGQNTTFQASTTRRQPPTTPPAGDGSMFDDRPID